MADWQLIEEGLKRGYSLDEVTDILAKEEGVDPSYARERGFDSPTILGRLGYAKPEATKPEKGFIGNVLDQAAHGVKTAYQGLLSAPGIYAGNPDAERIAGTIQAEQSHEKPKEMREAEAAFADVSKRQSDFESVYGKDSGYMDSIGKIMDMLVTTGKEIVTNPKGMAYEMASQSGNMVAPMVGAYAGGKTGAVTGALLGPKGAVAGGVVGAGAGGFAGSHVMEQSGEFRGKVAERLTELGLEPTAENVSAIFQDKAWLDKTLEETRDKATGTAVTDGVLAAIGGLAVNAPIRAAQKTARAQLGATATAKQVSDAASDILASQPKWQKVAPHLKAGAIGWGGEPISEAAGQQYGYGHIDYGDVGMEAFAAAGEGIGSVYAAAKGMRTNPTPPANVTPSPSITSAPTTDGAIKAFQDEVASVTPRGSFGSMDDLAGLIESERSDLGKRRGLLAQQQQDARDMENEFNGLVKDEQIDQSYRLNDAQQQRDAERARDGGYDLALQQREEQQGRTVEQQVAASEAQGFGEQEPTAMQLAMQLAKQKALDSEFDGLLKQERTSINELRANVKKVAGVPVESISTPQLEEIAQSEAHPNTKMAAVAALNDRHDAIQQERERLMQLRETRLERQSNQPEQGAQHGAESHEADGQVATPSVAGGGIDVPGGGFDAAMVASVGGVRGTAGAGAAVSRSGQVGAVPVADQPANVRALTENAAKRQATQLTNQGYPTAAYPHPTQAGMWAIGSQDEAKAATVPAPSATQNDVPPRQSASWVIRNKETGEVVMETFDRKKVDALNTAKYEAVPIREYLEGLNKRNESTAAEPPAVEVRSPVKRKLPASNNIAQAIINMGGVSTSLKNDILGDASIKTRPGLFTTNGTGDLGEIAAMLSSGFGFSQIDLNDPTDNSGAKQLADLIARSVNGETIHNEEAMIRAQQDEEFEQAKAEVNQQAAGLNIKPIRGKRTLEIVQAEINAILAEREEMTRRSREVQPLFDEVAEQELIDEFNLKVQEYHDENAIARADRAEESARLSAEESAQGDGDSVDQAAPSESRTSPTEGGRGEAEVTPEFGLVGQTEAEAISEQERLNQPEGLTKEQIDREAAAPFSLDGGTLAPEGAGVQGSMLTPDGRVSKDAEAKPAENKPTREFIGTGDKLYSESGRALAPAPKIETGTDRKINASTKRMNAWLLDEARKEAEANGNDWQQTLLRGIDANKMQKPDQDTVNDILFGDPDGPQAKHRAPHEGTVETPREAQSILKPLNPDAEAIAKADADFESALSDLGDIVGKSFRHNFTPEQEQKIIPVLTRLFDAAFRKGYYAFKDAARFVLDTIKAKFGVDIEEQITLQHMQGAYVGMSGRYRDQGVVRTDLSKEAAKAIDEYTFKKDGGYFIREKHLAALSDGVAMFSRGRGKLRSRPRGEITHETQRLEKEINRDLARQGQATIGAAGFITRSAVPDNAHRLVKAVEKLFGVRVEFVQVEDERANIFNGVFLGGNTLFVNVDSSSPISTVIGHEFLHFLKESNHDIYAKVEKDLLALANARKFAAAAIKHQPAMNAGEEVIADTFGDQFSNPEFWEELANRLAPSLFMRVRAAFTRFLGKLLGEIKATGTTHKTDALYSDLSAVRDAVLSATVEAANGRKLATPEWRSLHARFMTAWHGSPHDHDGFSMAHIGTGEGAQAYGYGLYFAGAREVAEGYRVALTSSAAKKQFDVAAALAAAKWFKSGMVVNGTTYYSRMDLQDDIAKQNLSSMHMPDEVRQVFADKLSERNGRLYQVELAPAEDKFLDWDKPFDEQSARVRSALENDIGFTPDWATVSGTNTGKDIYQALSSEYGGGQAASKLLHENGIRGIRYLDGGSRRAGEGNSNYVIFDDADVTITAKESRRAANPDTPADAGVSVSAPSESVRRIQAVVERFKSQFKGASALDIRVVSTTFDIPARFRPSPFAEGVFHDDAGLVYLVTMNLHNPRGELSENRAWQVLLHESVGHYGLSQMMGDKFASILKAVKQATLAGRKVSETQSNPLQPGDKDYTTWEAVKLRYPDATDAELAQEVLARMSETDPGSSVLGYAVAVVRQWVRDVARAMGIDLAVSTSELRDLVAKASGYMRRGDNLAEEHEPSGLVAASTGVAREGGKRGLESRAATVQPQGPIWSAPEMSRTDNIIYTMQDKNIDLKRVQQAIKETVGEIRDDIDAYLQEELFHGRAAKITEEFLDKDVNPLISLMRASNVSMDELETFLWARHAKERNAQIAKINDEMPDGGSGLTNKQADDLMGGKDVTIGDKTIAGVKPARKKLLSDLAGRVDVITKGSRALLERYGLESAETLNAWDGAYQHYVPLHREDTDSHLAGMGTGQGYSVKGSSSKRATGSFRPVENILANLVLQRERIITRGEKNRVAQALHGLAKEMPNADLWEVDVKPTIRTTAMIGGREQVVDAVDPNFRNKPNVVFARFNGEDRFVVFNEHNERAVRMAEALKNLDADDISHLLGEVSRWTRYFASINTQYNPIFGVTNLVRDVQTGLLNLKSTPLDGKQMEMAGGLVHALPAVFKALRADRKGQSATGTWAQLWEEFQEVGGQTGYRDMFRNSHERAEALQNALDPAWWQKTWWGKAATVGGILAAPEQVFVEKVGKPFMELLSDYNTMMENGIRLSAYKLALDSGMTKERAASLAKNLTVNFNRKGQAGRQVGAMYAFFNASVQGTARMAETLNHGAKPGELLGKAGKQIVYGGLMLGALQAMLLLAAGFDDEEPPEFVRDRNIIIPTGNGKYISIPLPLGFHVLPTIGRISIEFTAGGFKKPGEHLVHIMDVLLDSFNPIGNAGLSMQTLAPTVLDPVAALTENKDWSGRQIARQDFSKLNPTPGYTRAKDTASSLSRGLAYALNYLSGGGEYGIGIVSPTPDQIEYLIGQVTGGVGRELGKVATTGEAIGTGEDLPPHKIPLVGRFYGDTMGQSSEASKFYGTLEKLAEHKGALDRMKDAHASEAYQDYLRKHPESRLYGRAASVQREVANLRKLKRQLLDRGADRAKIRQVEDRMKAVMARFNQSASEHIRNQQ